MTLIKLQSSASSMTVWPCYTKKRKLVSLNKLVRPQKGRRKKYKGRLLQRKEAPACIEYGHVIFRASRQIKLKVRVNRTIK